MCSSGRTLRSTFRAVYIFRSDETAVHTSTRLSPAHCVDPAAKAEFLRLAHTVRRTMPSNSARDRCIACGAASFADDRGSASNPGTDWCICADRARRISSRVPTVLHNRALTISALPAKARRGDCTQEYIQDLSSIKPGTEDDKRFEQHWSITFWRGFTVPSSIRNEELPFSARCCTELALVAPAPT